MKRPLYSGSIVSAKYSDAFGNEGEIFAIHLSIRQRYFPALETWLQVFARDP